MKLNDSVLLCIIIGVGIQIPFAQSPLLNIGVTVISILYLICNRVSLKRISILLLVSVPLAIGTGTSFLVFGTGDVAHVVWLQISRLYALLFLGACLTLTTKISHLLQSMIIHLHLSPTFAYGIIAAFNLLPRAKQQIILIRYAAMIKGTTYHIWSPQLYVKAIMNALRWSTDLSEVMTARGFSEGEMRTQYRQDTLNKIQWLYLVVIVLCYFTLSFYM